ncbi:MAG: carbohydrate ABC transporter permease [Anaerolineae bacterium]|nr:carbohydrate ABC transporter permease [Anaerolineae bacterium]
MATYPKVARQTQTRLFGVTWSRYRARRWLTRGIKYLVLIVFLVYFFLPIFWITSAALRPGQDVLQDPFGLPRTLQLSNLLKAWNTGRFNRYVWNTVIYCATTVTGVLIISSLAGFGLAQLQFPGRDFIFTVTLLGLMVPFQSIMIPLYYLARDLHILGTYWAMILPGIGLGLPFGVFLMRAFFRGLPHELADAAKIDGCNEWGVFWRVMLPLAYPGLITLAIFQFRNTWNAFALPLVLVPRDVLRPVATGMLQFQSRFTSDRAGIAAAALITSIPVLLLYLILQRQFVRGITAGALKG